jgi:hypothetical protein
MSDEIAGLKKKRAQCRNSECFDKYTKLIEAAEKKLAEGKTRKSEKPVKVEKK